VRKGTHAVIGERKTIHRYYRREEGLSERSVIHIYIYSTVFVINTAIVNPGDFMFLEIGNVIYGTSFTASSAVPGRACR
jgi:hypothetical protein